MKLVEIAPSELFFKDAEAAVDKFNKSFIKMFPEKKWIAKAKLGNMLGSVIIVTFADKDWEVTIHNSRFHMSWMMHLPSNGIASKLSIELNMQSSMMKNSGITYRKITSKTVDDGLTKLLKWFKKHEKTIKNPTPDRKMILKKVAPFFGANLKDKKATITVHRDAASAIDVASGTDVVLQALTTDQLYAILKTVYHGQ